MTVSGDKYAPASSKTETAVLLQAADRVADETAKLMGEAEPKAAVVTLRPGA